MIAKKKGPSIKKSWQKFKKLLKSKPPWILALLAEGVLLMLSVLFALVLNERRFENQQATKANVALEAIRSELQKNIAGLDRAKSHHKAIRDTLQYFQDINAMPPPEIYLEKGLFQPAYLFSTAWETSKQTGIIDEFSYELSLELSEVYKDQAQYEELGNIIVHETYRNMLNLGPSEALRDNYKNWSLITWDFSNREERLKTKLTTALSKLENRNCLKTADADAKTITFLD